MAGPTSALAGTTVLAPRAVSAAVADWRRVILAPNTREKEPMNPTIDASSRSPASAIHLGHPATSRAGK
jgi:hypothetical protein